MAPIGIMIELVIKSKKSKKSIPNKVTEDNGPKPKEERLPKRTIIPATNKEDLVREKDNSSSMVDTALSAKAIDEVSAANKTNKKNKIPAPCPKPIDAKTFGKVINIKEGPACKAD